MGTFSGTCDTEGFDSHCLSTEHTSVFALLRGLVKSQLLGHAHNLKTPNKCPGKGMIPKKAAIHAATMSMSSQPLVQPSLHGKW